MVRVWTISAQSGVDGRRVATELADTLQIPLLDRDALLELTGQGGTADDLDDHMYNRVQQLGLTFAANFGAVQATQELQFLTELGERSREVMKRLGHERCVILAPSAVGAMPDHDQALHVRLWAPIEWRIERYAGMCMVSAAEAKHRVRELDRVQGEFASRLYQLDLNDLHRFDVAFNARTVDPRRLVAAILAAGGHSAAEA